MRSTALFIHQNNDSNNAYGLKYNSHNRLYWFGQTTKEKRSFTTRLHSNWTQLFFHKEKQEISHAIQILNVIQLRGLIIQRLTQRNLITIQNTDCPGVAWKHHPYLTRCLSPNTGYKEENKQQQTNGQWCTKSSATEKKKRIGCSCPQHEKVTKDKQVGSVDALHCDQNDAREATCKSVQLKNWKETEELYYDWFSSSPENMMPWTAHRVQLETELQKLYYLISVSS